MGANRYMVDAGGTTRHIRKRYAIDAGGVARLIRRRYIIDPTGVARLTFLYAVDFSGIAGTSVLGIGFSASSMGTINGSGLPFALPGGQTLFSIYNTAGPTNSILQIANLGADPGAAWLNYIMIGTTKKLATDAGTTYSFTTGGAGTATWHWSTAFPNVTGGGFSGSQPFTGELSHN